MIYQHIDFIFSSRTFPFLKDLYKPWIEAVINSEGYKMGEISYTFCDDDTLQEINSTYLNHEDLTDIITFDNVINQIISGDIFISVDRVKENARNNAIPFDVELERVMIHGVLHLCGYKDKRDAEKKLMRQKESYYLSTLNKA